MPKLDFYICCDLSDAERAEIVADGIDANAKTYETGVYDSTEKDQFAVAMDIGNQRADRVILLLSRNFQPLQFTVPVFEASIPQDPRCNKAKVFAVALDPLIQRKF